MNFVGLRPAPRFICHHKLSWPRRTLGGEHYQVCLECGARFGYDWTIMRRLRRLPDASDPLSRSKHPVGSAVRWVPRERRVRCCLPVLYRIGKTDQWQRGYSENISMSGFAFRAHMGGMAAGTLLEVIIEEPRELTGIESMQVHCSGVVVRTVATGGDQQRLVACARKDYRSTVRLRAA